MRTLLHARFPKSPVDRSVLHVYLVMMKAMPQTVPRTAKEPTRSPEPWWRVPAGLIVLSAVPVGAGLVRLVRLAVGETVTVDNARFVASPLPVVVHVISATLFCVLGVFQFVPMLRRGRGPWHHMAGRWLVPFGLAAALSGLGESERAREWNRRALQMEPDDPSVLYNIACVFAREALPADAVAALSKAVDNGFGHWQWIEHDTDLDPVRSDPAFIALLERKPSAGAGAA